MVMIQTEPRVNDLKILLFPSYLYHLDGNYEYHMTIDDKDEWDNDGDDGSLQRPDH